MRNQEADLSHNSPGSRFIGCRLVCVRVQNDRHLSDRPRARIVLAGCNNVIDTRLSGRCINAVFANPPAILLINSPPYSNTIFALNDGRKFLRLANVDGSLRRIDGHEDRCLLDTLAWGKGERKNKE